MNLWILTLILFIAGLFEYIIDQYQKITLARLKFWQATLLQYLNKLLEFVINVLVFATIVDFYSKLKEGHYDWAVLGPYLAYFHGCVLGTAIAIIIYRRLKRKRDRERRVRHLEKARLKKKQYKNQLSDVELEIEEEKDVLLADEFDQEDLKQEIVEQATEQIVDRVTKSVKKALERVDVNIEELSDEEVHNQINSDGEISTKEER